MKPPPPVLVVDLFREDREALLRLLDELSADEWERPTVCAGWSVRDVAAHVLGGDLGNLSRRRDGFSGVVPAADESLLDFINRINDEWMQAARRLSPQVLRELLAVAGTPLFDYFASLDPFALGPAVSWAGPDPAPVWLDVAREYTERWHHQQHIRDAVGRPGQTSRRFLHPVLATFAHALPVALSDLDAPPGTTVHLHVEGEAGDDWLIVRETARWRLYTGRISAPDARVTLDQDTAWRLFTKGISPHVARGRVLLEGDHHFGEQLLHTVAIIA